MKMQAARITAIQGIGTSESDEEGYVHVTLSDGTQRAICFDEQLGNPLAIAFLAAATHLETKRAIRRDPHSTEIAGKPVSIRTATAFLATRGPDRVMIIELQTPEGATLRFELPVRAAEVLAKRMQKKGTARKSPPRSPRRPPH